MAEWGLARFSGIPREKLLSGNLDLADSRALSLAEARFGDVCPVIHFDSRRLEDLIATATRIRYDAIFVDYLQLVEAPGDDMARVAHVSKTLARLTGKGGGIVRGYTPMVVAISQFNRSGIVDQRDNDRFPELTDLKGSSQIEQDADSVIFLHRFSTQKPHDPRVYAKIGKNRTGPAGDVIALDARPTLGYLEEAPPDAPGRP